MFQGKTVLITGANSGIGKSCVSRFMKDGATIVAVVRRKKETQYLINELTQSGDKVYAYYCDLNDTRTINEMFDEIQIKHSAIDFAINSAGIEGLSYTKITDYPESIWDEVINVNLKSVWLCMKREIKIMLENKSGAIVNIASLAGLQASMSGGTPYTASKFGVVGITRATALEVAADGIRVNAICPGVVRTPMAEKVLGNSLEVIGCQNPMGKVCEPEDVANMAAWLCSKEASFVTGVAIPLDGGLTA